MRVLSLSRPWPWAIFHPVHRKHVENRSWMPPLAVIGQRIAIHAAKSKDETATRTLLALGIDDMPSRWEAHPEGVIVGVVTIDRVVTEARTLTPDQARWFFGPVGWVLTDVRAIATPIAHRGGQGLRELPTDVEAAVIAGLTPP